MNKEFKVRFAPSPTGPFHIGGARSALFNWLVARHQNGKFLVRIEDTDLVRSTRESEENIKKAMKWLGLYWDECIDVGGENGPYRQTERLPLYNAAVQRLLEEGKAYYCYCSADELEESRSRSVTFAHFFVVRSENKRYMSKFWDFISECLIYSNLTRGIR